MLLLKPNTAIVSVLESVNLKDYLFDKDEEDLHKVVGISCAAKYSKVKILEVSKQLDPEKQLQVEKGDTCIMAEGAISVVNRESDITIGFVYTDNILAKIVD